jgi:hypothetical protein
MPLRFHAFAAALIALAAVSGAQGPTGRSEPLDPQRVRDQQEMTWADYRPIPGMN